MPAPPAWWTRRRSNAAVRSATIAEPLSEDQVVWMVGSPRTGSTWLLNLMGLHKRVRAIDEPLIGAHLGLSLASLVAMERAASDSGHARVVDRYAGREDYF